MTAIERLVTAVDDVLSIAVHAASCDEVENNLAVIARQVNRLQAAICEHAAAMTTARERDKAQRTRPVDFLKSQCHMSGAQARDVMKCSEILNENGLSGTALALRTGSITWPHATTVVRGVNKLGLAEVKAREQVWIDNVATATGPERLQRVVQARVHEVAATPPRSISRPAERRPIALHPSSSKAYQVSGVVTREEGARILRAIDLAHASATSKPQDDPVVWIISDWLAGHDAAEASAGPEWGTTSERKEMSETTVDRAAIMKVATRPVQASDVQRGDSGLRFSVALTVGTELPQAIPGYNGCASPGCLYDPQWCDQHSASRLPHTREPHAA
ncbi:hypothetical protein GCM10010174_20720 [Kutzneria viridogrisea]|uniref:Uncharacterized protein n=2 Tax=Kutzneria TaxID=43356 RepID=W5W1M3_9PSEU|nr:DUF222 domain-containing protein [Kutzneria albida]AHH94451.1 hypothetical protein KALB_1078 [Kutzneria albida DSM 43870]MBA8930119.1 hypothetical protein [Kutzneria viridogrisea]